MFIFSTGQNMGGTTIAVQYLLNFFAPCHLEHEVMRPRDLDSKTVGDFFLPLCVSLSLALSLFEKLKPQNLNSGLPTETARLSNESVLPMHD